MLARGGHKGPCRGTLILDDILGSLKSGSRVNTLSARFRHYNIKLLLFSTQVFRYVSNVVRQNTTNLIVGLTSPNGHVLHTQQQCALSFGARAMAGSAPAAPHAPVGDKPADEKAARSRRRRRRRSGK